MNGVEGMGQEVQGAGVQMEHEEVEAAGVADDKGIGADMGGIVRALGDLPGGTIVTEKDLAKIFRRHVVSIRRAWQQRRELPPPTRLLNARCWTVSALLAHIEGRLAEAQKARETMLKRTSQFSS